MTKQTGKKLILIAAALLIVILLVLRMILTGDTIRPVEPEVKEPSAVTGERITRAEAVRLFSFFFYTDTQRKALKQTATFTFQEGDIWYDEYVNAAVAAGYLVNSGSDFRGEDNLTCGEFRDLLVRVTGLCSVSYADLMQKLPERLKTAKVGDELLLGEFLYFYRLCMEACEQEGWELPIDRTGLFVLNVTTGTNNGRTVLITDDETEYYAGHFQDYSDFFSSPDYGPQIPVSDLEFREYPLAGDYLDCSLEVLYCGTEIVFITEHSDHFVTLPNAWILRAKQTTVHAFVNGQEREFQLENALKDSIYERVADITVSKGCVTAITVKPDTINGKVLLTGTDEIEIDGYGTLVFDHEYRIYKLYDGLEMEQTNSILVGYDNVTFVLSDGKICAALIMEKIKAENIRVLISVQKTTDYTHEEVVLTSDQGMLLSCGDEIREYEAGETVTIRYEDMVQLSPRVKVESLAGSGRIQILSIVRSYGHPKYRGTIEISSADDGLLIVNELSLEEYLYSVVPSEMPTAHGEEALKVQAVCARSYAYMQLLANRYSKYGAHIDDTVNCQVYNNVSENASSIFAVKDTYGKVMEYNGKIVNAYYFSTSCGYSSSVEDVWAEVKATEYFTGTLQADPESLQSLTEACSAAGDNRTSEELAASVDLSEEADFEAFIDGNMISIDCGSSVVRERIATYDSSFSWYRWNVTMEASVVSEQIDSAIAARYRANPADILTMTSRKGIYTTPSGAVVSGTFSQYAVSTIGTVTGIEVLSRAKSGMITELLVKGTANTVIIRNQTNVRQLLAPVSTTVYLANQVTLDGFSLMPSAYFYIETEKINSETFFTFYGGGYGHGVGMSQNGVKGMIDNGFEYEAILTHYYPGVTFGFIY